MWNRQVTTDHNTHLFLSTGPGSPAAAAVARLHLENRPEEVVAQRRQELDLSVGVKAVQVGTLRRQRLVDIRVVTFIVGVGRDGEARGQVQLAIELQG